MWLRQARGDYAATCFLTPALPTGVDLSNIIKLVPKVSADGLQEPTHDIVQVGGGGLCGCGPMHITGSLLSVHLLSGSQMTHTGSEGQGLPSVCQ